MIPKLESKFENIFKKYRKYCKDMMTNWISNIVKTDLPDTVDKNDDDLLVTPAPVDLFKMINQQIFLVEEADVGVFLISILGRIKWRN